MTDVQIAVGLGGKAGVHAAVVASGLDVGADHLADEVAGVAGRADRLGAGVLRLTGSFAHGVVL